MMRHLLLVVACWALCCCQFAAAQGREPNQGLKLPFPVPDAVQGVLDKLNDIAYRVSPLDQIAAPTCLHQLKGGIDPIERALASALDHGQTPMVLVTTKSDRNSLPAMENFYDAVRVLCREAEPDFEVEAKKITEQVPFDINNDDHDDGLHAEPESDAAMRRRALEAAKTYYFAHISFDSEPDIAWRWWIWKVPVIVFVTRPTSPEQHYYDLRYWKIGFKVPSKIDFVDAIPDRYWMNLPVWDSAIAPGMPWEIFTTALAKGFGQTYKVLDPIPNWLLTIVGSMFGSVVISMLHSKSGTAGRR